MIEAGLAHSINIEPNFMQGPMVEVVAAVENKGGFFHQIENFLIIQFSELLPFR